MFKRILVAIDFSAYTEVILGCIKGIPGVKDIVLLHVFDATHASMHGWTYDPAIENVKILMDEKKKNLESHGYHVIAHVGVITSGTICREILHFAEKECVSLIVTGARGKGLINDILLGSVSQSILRNAKTCVLIIHDTTTIQQSLPNDARISKGIFSNILLPTDFSPHSYLVVKWVKEQEAIAQVTILNVVDHGETEREIEEIKREAQQQLDSIAQELAASGRRVKTQIRIGDRTDMILSAAESDDASIIILGPHGNGGFRELFIGSTTFDVAKRAKIPVLVVRTENGG